MFAIYLVVRTSFSPIARALARIDSSVLSTRSMYRYLGNKTRLAGWISEIVQTNLAPGARIADLMCGTASMSVAFASNGYAVVAADQLTFPVLHAEARLLLPSAPDFSGVADGTYVSALSELNQTPSIQGFFYSEYSNAGEPQNGAKPRAYFSAANAAKIDGIRARLHDWTSSSSIPEVSYRLLLQDLLMAVNRVANIAGTYGFYRSSLAPASLQPIQMRPTKFNAQFAGPRHETMQGQVERVALLVEADALYLDPPYTKRQYAGNYHLLETIARNDTPEPQGEGGLRPWLEDSSDFCLRRKAPQAFRKVLENCSTPDVFVSYSEDGQVPPESLLSLFREFGEVTRHTVDFKRYKSNQNARGDAVAEHLYHIRK